MLLAEGSSPPFPDGQDSLSHTYGKRCSTASLREREPHLHSLQTSKAWYYRSREVAKLVVSFPFEAAEAFPLSLMSAFLDENPFLLSLSLAAAVSRLVGWRGELRERLSGGTFPGRHLRSALCKCQRDVRIESVPSSPPLPRTRARLSTPERPFPPSLRSSPSWPCMYLEKGSRATRALTAAAERGESEVESDLPPR